MNANSRYRVTLLALLVVAMAAAIGFRLYTLQVQQGAEFRRTAEKQQQRRMDIFATRGSILDRHGRELALSLASKSLYVHPGRVDDAKKYAELLAPVLGARASDLMRKLDSERGFAYLARKLDPRQVDAIRRLELPMGNHGPFGFIAESKRYYPRGKLAAHVVGFTNIDNIGREGAEGRLDDILSGDPTRYLIVKDARSGERLRKIVTPPERVSHDVVLTIDLMLQHIVERELERAMAETGAISASAVLLDPATGQILALANRPTGDLNKVGSARPDARRNRAVTDQYEPGSTFKIISMSAALDRGVVQPDQRIDCENGSHIFFKGRKVHDSKPHGRLSARQVLERSSNIGMVKITGKLEPRTLHEYITSFGFGQETGVELTGEHGGALRPLPDWNEHSMISLAFGHEISVTALQMASAFATIANDGVQLPPRIVLSRIGPDGSVREEPPPTSHRVISRSTARALTAMLEGATTSGTGTRARLRGYRVAGKTGTTEKLIEGKISRTKHIASFGGFAPARAPRLVGLVVLDEPSRAAHLGGQVAAPVFRRIFEDALSYLRIPGDDDVMTVAELRGSAQ